MTHFERSTCLGREFGLFHLHILLDTLLYIPFVCITTLDRVLQHEIAHKLIIGREMLYIQQKSHDTIKEFVLHY